MAEKSHESNLRLRTYYVIKTRVQRNRETLNRYDGDYEYPDTHCFSDKSDRNSVPSDDESMTDNTSDFLSDFVLFSQIINKSLLERRIPVYDLTAFTPKTSVFIESLHYSIITSTYSWPPLLVRNG